MITALPEGLVAQPTDERYVTPVVLATMVQSQSHVSATPTPARTEPSDDALRASQEVPITEHDPNMAKYYAPIPCPPMPAQPSQTTTFTWPNSSEDVALVPTPPAEPAPPHPVPAEKPVVPAEPLFFSPSPPTVLAPLPRDSAVSRALSSMAMGRTLAEDLMDIEAGVPLPQLSTPLLRNPLLVDATEEDILLFSHIKPLQGAALARAAGVLPEELLPQPRPTKEVPAPPPPPAVEPVLPDSAPPTQEAPFSRDPPSDTYEDTTLSQNLAHLAGLFPSASSETFTIVLEKTNGDLAAASAWMQSVTDVHRLKGVLMGAFPDAPESAVEKSLRHYKGDFLLSFYGLTRNYKQTEDWADFKRISRKGVMDIDDLAPEFVYDDPATEAYEWQWWQIAISIRSHRANGEQVKEMWSRLAGIATAPRDITPRFVDYVRRLGLKNSSKTDFEQAVRTLRAQSEFQAIEACAGPAIPCGPDSPRDPAFVVLQVLLSDGIPIMLCFTQY